MTDSSEGTADARSLAKWPDLPFNYGDLVRKKQGSQWRGRICGWYSTELTPIGFAVKSSFESNAVQVYPVTALEPWNGQ